MRCGSGSTGAVWRCGGVARQVLGKGAFGLVKLVRHKEAGSAHALKIMAKNIIVEKNHHYCVVQEKARVGV